MNNITNIHPITNIVDNGLRAETQESSGLLQLPDEVLVEIFSYAISDDYSNGYNLSLVCRKIQEIVNDDRVVAKIKFKNLPAEVATLRQEGNSHLVSQVIDKIVLNSSFLNDLLDALIKFKNPNIKWFVKELVKSEKICNGFQSQGSVQYNPGMTQQQLTFFRVMNCLIATRDKEYIDCIYEQMPKMTPSLRVQAAFLLNRYGYDAEAGLELTDEARQAHSGLLDIFFAAKDGQVDSLFQKDKDFLGAFLDAIIPYMIDQGYKGQASELMSHFNGLPYRYIMFLINQAAYRGYKDVIDSLLPDTKDDFCLAMILQGAMNGLQYDVIDHYFKNNLDLSQYQSGVYIPFRKLAMANPEKLSEYCDAVLEVSLTNARNPFTRYDATNTNIALRIQYNLINSEEELFSFMQNKSLTLQQDQIEGLMHAINSNQRDILDRRADEWVVKIQSIINK